LVALSSTSSAFLDRSSSRLFPCHRSPPPCGRGSFPREVSPFQSPLRPPGCPTSWSGPTPLRFFAPSTTSLALAPCEVDCHVRLGSALRFSQPLSGFLASSSFAALFHAATVRGVLPSESSPHRDRVPLSRPLAPLWLSTSVQRRTHPSFVTARFTDVHVRRRSCLDPLAAMSSLSTRRGALPGPSEPERAEPSRSADFTHFEALIPP